jgi:hypothetical protein
MDSNPLSGTGGKTAPSGGCEVAPRRACSGATGAFGGQGLPCRPPEAKARNQRFADIRGTLNRRATSRSLAPASINGVWGPSFVTKQGKEGIVVLGQVARLGFGTVIGGGATAALAALHVWTARRAFGPLPTSWPSPTPGTPITAEDSLG